MGDQPYCVQLWVATTPFCASWWVAVAVEVEVALVGVGVYCGPPATVPILRPTWALATGWPVVASLTTPLTLDDPAARLSLCGCNAPLGRSSLSPKAEDGI